MDSDQSIQDNYLKRLSGQELLRTVARFIEQRAGLPQDATQIRQHSSLNTPQHLAAGAAAEASTSTNTIDPGTSEERQILVKTLLRELYRQYRAAKGEEPTAIQNLAEDVIKDALASGELSADEGGAAKMRFCIYPATVADMGSPTGIVHDTGSPEDKIIEHDADFFNAFEDDFDDRDLD